MTAARIVAVDDSRALDLAADALRAGDLVVIPTDTVYGLAAAADDPAAVAAIFDRKGRAADVPVAVLGADAGATLSLGDIDERTRALAAEHWPGPLTIVVSRRAGLDWALGASDHTIGLRCPDHDFVRALARTVGPLAVTSANRHGEPTPATAARAAASLVGPVALVVDGGSLEGTASTVVDATGAELRVLRQGAVTI